jgi:hypothetical protein
MLFRAGPDLKTMKIMKGDNTVMIGERTMSHLYKLQGCTVASGVMEDGVAGLAVFSEGDVGWLALSYKVNNPSSVYTEVRA